MDLPSIPEGYQDALSGYGPVLFDGWCGEPIAWGFQILRHLGEDRFNALARHGSLECVSMGKWCLVTKWLTPAEAIQKYGPVTKEERGPRGGFRSVTYGTKNFLSRRLDPLLQARPLG